MECLNFETGVFKVRIFNSIHKTKYFIALALLLTFAVFVAPINFGETFTKPVSTDYPVKSNSFFNYADIHTAFFVLERTESFSRFESVKDLKQRHSVTRQEKILPATKLLLEKFVNNVYATARIPYYAEVCKLLAQLIVIYMFMTDGKKRSYKLSYN